MNQQQTESSSSIPASATSPPSTHQGCCETGRPIVTDPVTGQTVCSCQYDRLAQGLVYGPAAAAAAAARLQAVTAGVVPSGLHGVYGTAYPSSDQNPYPSLGMDSTAFYSSLVS